MTPQEIRDLPALLRSAERATIADDPTVGLLKRLAIAAADRIKELEVALAARDRAYNDLNGK